MNYTIITKLNVLHAQPEWSAHHSLESLEPYIRFCVFLWQFIVLRVFSSSYSCILSKRSRRPALKYKANSVPNNLNRVQNITKRDLESRKSQDSGISFDNEYSIHCDLREEGSSRSFHNYCFLLMTGERGGRKKKGDGLGQLIA